MSEIDTILNEAQAAGEKEIREKRRADELASLNLRLAACNAYLEEIRKFELGVVAMTNPLGSRDFIGHCVGIYNLLICHKGALHYEIEKIWMERDKEQSDGKA